MPEYPAPEPIHVPPVGVGKAEAIRALDDALVGVPKGEHDERVLGWLTIWDVPTLVTIASLFERTRQAGYADGRKDTLSDAHT